MSTRSRGSCPTSWLMTPLVLLVLCRGSHQIAKNFVNSSTPDLRPTFVVNFDTSTVICQHSSDPTDLHIHNMSSLCDGKQDCFVNPAMHDEVFPYCEHKCESTCSGKGACLYDGSKPQCYCDSGFSGAACELQDKNECLEHPCHMMAQCQNTLGSYECRCLPGYQGNGHECSDIDECAENLATRCPEHSQCINLPGTYYCNCTQGFSPKGNQGSGLDKCADINECETGAHNCETNEICENTIGSFKCVTKCSPGYSLIDGKCEDVNECDSEKLHKCDVRAECINTVGGYECECEEGFDGDGKNCQPKSSCRKNSAICDRHASCNIFLDICDCKTGYTGDGITCHDVNECDAKETPCSEGGRCLNLDGGYVCCKEGQDDAACIKGESRNRFIYQEWLRPANDQGAFCSGGCGDNAICSNATCACIDGFRGDPHKKCVDINECVENDSVCGGVGDRCVNLFGGYKCCQHGSQEAECTDQAFSSDSSTVSSHGADFTTTGEQIIEGSGSIQTSSGGSITVTRGLIPKEVELTTSGRLACTSYCPPNSECVGGFCECVKGYGGNALVGCEDVDECITETCNVEANEWCVNLIGGFVCCNPTNATHDDCIGLEITKEKGLHVIGPNEEDTVVATRSNHSVTSDQLITEVVQQSKNFSSGQIILTRKSVTGGEAVTQTTDGDGEFGLEISAKDFGITIPATLEPRVEGSGKAAAGVWTEEEDGGEDDDLMEASGSQGSGSQGSGSWSTTINGTGFTGSPRSEGTIRVRITTLGEDGETETATKPGITVPGKDGKLAIEKEGHESVSTGEEAAGKSGKSESGASGSTATGGSAGTTETESSGKSESGSAGSSTTGESGSSATSSSGSTESGSSGSSATSSSGSTELGSSGSTATGESGASESGSSGSTATEEPGINGNDSSGPSRSTSSPVSVTASRESVEGSGTTPSESTSSVPEGSGEWIETGSKGHFERGNKVSVSHGNGKPEGSGSQESGKSGKSETTVPGSEPKGPEITTDGEDSESTSSGSGKPKNPKITTDGEGSESTPTGDGKHPEDVEGSGILTTSSGGKNATLEHGTKLVEVKPEGSDKENPGVGLEISAGKVTNAPEDKSNEVGLEIVWESTTPEPTTPDTDNVGLEISGRDLITKRPHQIEGSGTGDEEITATTRDVSKSTKKPRLEIDGGDNGETSGVDGKATTPSPTSPAAPESTKSSPTTPDDVTPETGSGELGIPDGSGESSTAAPEGVSPTSSAPVPEVPTTPEGSGESTKVPEGVEGSGEATTEVAKPSEATKGPEASSAAPESSNKPSEATKGPEATSAAPKSSTKPSEATKAPEVTSAAPESSTKPSEATEASEKPSEASKAPEATSATTPEEETTTQEPLILTAAPTKAPESSTKPSEATKASETSSEATKAPEETSAAPESSAKPSGAPEATSAPPTAQPATVIPPQNREEKPEPTKETFALPTTTEKPINETIENTKCTSSDECGLDALCERRTGVCRCEPGFEGAPPKKACVDVDECATGDHKCHDSARCQNFIGGYACFCPTGFRKTDDGSCEDIDECKEHNSTCCGANAHCVNKPGTYSCECENGFLGDGYHCVPSTKKPCDKEQSTKSHCAESNMSCEVDTTDGSVECKECMSGYKKSGTICEDINECDEQSPCSPSASCVNLNGTFSCSCKPGFRGDGFMCTDINECDEKHPCHPHAECTNLEGSFKCECHSGFEGDGIKKCTNPLERSCEDVEKFCGRVDHVSCLSVRIYNGSLSSVCECEPGFRFEKESNSCVDIDECEENRNNCDPASAVCVNTEGSFKCECAEGYEGEGGVCTDIDECDRGMAGCDSMAMCINRMGSCGCKCMAGYTGDGAHCTKIEEPKEASKTACTEEWSRLCELEKKQCAVDEEGFPNVELVFQDIIRSMEHAKVFKFPDCALRKTTLSRWLYWRRNDVDDVDECNNVGMCDDENSKCENTIGSFNCVCLEGFKKSDDDKCVLKTPNREKIEIDEENSSSTPSESKKPESTTQESTTSSVTTSEAPTSSEKASEATKKPEDATSSAESPVTTVSSEPSTSSESPVTSSEAPESTTTSSEPLTTPAVDEGIATSTEKPLEEPTSTEDSLTVSVRIHELSTTSSEPTESTTTSSESSEPTVTSSVPPTTSSESPESSTPFKQGRTPLTSTTTRGKTTQEPLILTAAPSKAPESTKASEATTQPSKPSSEPSVTSSESPVTSAEAVTSSEKPVTSSEPTVTSSEPPTSPERPVTLSQSRQSSETPATSSTEAPDVDVSDKPVTTSSVSPGTSSKPVTSSVKSTKSPVTSSESPVTTSSVKSTSPVTSTPESTSSESPVTSPEATTSTGTVTSTSSVSVTSSEATTPSEESTSSEKSTSPSTSSVTSSNLTHVTRSNHVFCSTCDDVIF
ncbi:hypothetical protein B9Z55_011422 [Caenorhabditis nigoni]|uniref:EGF-like domain-containing protein n=1 Tax=Caenorhabditis nigoni TaxID=1611254 RepID=A0A2G5UJZ8_9PELO|nr:hypothetical protein B9Z55_011422 [Caenorhabditis nigoni]